MWVAVLVVDLAAELVAVLVVDSAVEKVVV